jgi:Helix-turn-helix domain
MANTCAEMQIDAPAENAETRITKIEIPLTQRAALTPREFAAQFGRSQTWAYRLIYAGAIKVIKPAGALLIPRTELDRLLNGAKFHDA